MEATKDGITEKKCSVYFFLSLLFHECHYDDNVDLHDDDHENGGDGGSGANTDSVVDKMIR